MEKEYINAVKAAWSGHKKIAELLDAILRDLDTLEKIQGDVRRVIIEIDTGKSSFNRVLYSNDEIDAIRRLLDKNVHEKNKLRLEEIERIKSSIGEKKP